MAAVYDRHAITTEEYVRAFECAPLQAGVVFAIDGQVLGLDLFNHRHTFHRMFPKLLRSYALDALETATGAVPAKSVNYTIGRVLEGIASAPSFAQPAIGLGKDVRISGKSMSGAALWASDCFIHICAFSVVDAIGTSTLRTRISRPTRRGGR